MEDTRTILVAGVTRTILVAGVTRLGFFQGNFAIPGIFPGKFCDPWKNPKVPWDFPSGVR